MISYLEKETSKYLEEILPPKTDFSVSISIARREEGVDVSVEVSIRGRLQEYREEAKSAINYARNKLIEWLELHREKIGRDTGKE